jgi:hypothetical protein
VENGQKKAVVLNEVKLLFVRERDTGQKGPANYEKRRPTTLSIERPKLSALIGASGAYL